MRVRPGFILFSVLLVSHLAHASAFAAWPYDPNANLQLSSAGNAELPTILQDGTGGAFIAWDDFRNGNYDLFVQHVLANGVIDPAWPASGRAVCTSLGDQRTAVLVGDGVGGLLVAWQDRRLPTDSDVYIQHVSSGGVVDPAWPVNGRAVVTAIGHQLNITMVSDGAGGAILAWEDFRVIPSDADIYAQRVLASGVVDPAWPVNGRALCTTPGSEALPKAVTDGAGGAIVAWDFLTGSGDVYANRVLASGVLDPIWPVNGKAVCALPASNQAGVSIAPSAPNGAILAWQDQRAAPMRVFASRVTSSGALDPFWPVDGRALALTGGGAQSAVALVTDDAGGAIAAWADSRNAVPDVYAQHVSVKGVVDPVWPVDGRAVCTAAGIQWHLVALADGAGGVFVAWSDERVGGEDAYAHHVLASGAVDPIWPANGRALSTANGSQSNPRLALDGGGGIIATWADTRVPTAYVYAQNADRWAYLGSPQPVIAGVRDVPNDQGGRVKLSWNASYLDPQSNPDVTTYDILRSVPPNLAIGRIAEGARVTTLASDVAGTELVAGDLVVPPGVTDAYYWEFVASVPALHYINAYSYVATTLGDSVAGSNPTTAFLVVARNAGTTRWWLSAPDSGYSVDDLGPATPAALTGEVAAGTTRLHWARNGEPDLAGYRVYRGSDPSFVPGPVNLIASPPDTGYVDPSAGAFVYKVTAIDAHGNESPVASVVPAGTVDVGDPALPRVASFLAPSPNPAFATTTLRFALPVAGRARLAIYDPAGRLVRTLADGPRDAGEHVERWDLRDDSGSVVGAGLYFARFEGAGVMFARRIVVVR